MSHKIFIISEYGLVGTRYTLTSSKKFVSACVPTDAYEEFEAFAKTEDGGKVLGFVGSGDCLRAKNYVGTIQTKGGYTLEILPKIYNHQNEEESKSIFMELLRILYKLPNFKQIDTANFKSTEMPILEIFIEMFLDEVDIIIKQGVKSQYLGKDENLYYLKGKLLVSEQIKYNHLHRERFYVNYDEYSQDRAENRLLKSTLKYLMSISNTYSNISRARQYIEHLQMITYSQNFDADFKKCTTKQRGMNHYDRALIWAKIFLKKESFSNFYGESIAFSILYPMERLFESYVEHWLWVNEPDVQDVIVTTVRDSFVFGDSGKDVASVLPDFLIKKDNCINIVADAKWKMINKDGYFSNSDFYQLFAYKHIYENKHKVTDIKLRLYYPQSEYLQDREEYEYFCGSVITICPIDMSDIINNDNKGNINELR